MSNSLDPDQARRFVWPDLGPNCFQKLSADDTSRYIVVIEFCRLTLFQKDMLFHFLRKYYPHILLGTFSRVEDHILR